MAVTEEIENLKLKSTSSVIFLSLRNLGIQGIAFFGFFFLTILLGPSDVGLFAVVAETIALLSYFSDIGLASALIQKKSVPTDEELQSSFTIQQTLVIISLIVVGIIYPSLAHSRHYGSKETWIFISLCFAFLAGSLKTIPSVLLERDLNFKELSSVDIIENTLFYTIAVVCALFGLGAYSYAVATFIRSTVGLIIIYRLKSWPLKINFSFISVKELFHYGVPFQLNTFIAMAKDRLSNLMVAGIIGREGFGLISWAQKGPRMPLTLMDSIMKVTFPAFARLQEDHHLLRRSIERSLYFISFFVFPAVVGIAFVAPDLMHLIPRYSKWEPALVPLYFFSASFVIAAVTTPLTNAFNAVGKILTTTKMMVVWTVLTWIFYPILSLRYGYIGTSVAAFLVGSSSLFVWYLAYKHFHLNIFATLIHPIISTILITIILFFISDLHLYPLLSIVSKILISILIYTSYHLIFSQKEIVWFFNQIKCLRK
ncbi:oligosaccharide flippase family protein [Patescibacteria group bacterium]|nr:oligosaccharide flippase family protein [Patescibacteria group bacterium]